MSARTLVGAFVAAPHAIRLRPRPTGKIVSFLSCFLGVVWIACSALPASADPLDQFCKTARLPSNIAICSDPELRALTIEREQAYNEARSRLDPAGRRQLLAGQNAWVKSYPLACGLQRGVPPALPLANSIQQCMAQAGRGRTAYLRSYADAHVAPRQPLAEQTSPTADQSPASENKNSDGPAESPGEQWETIAVLRI